MSRLLLLFYICLTLVSTCRSETLSEHYSQSGELLLVHLPTAPFPHPQRAEGHKYKEQFFSAAEHYTNDTVAIFIPKSFRETGKIDFVIHFHGWQNNVEGVLKRYQLIEQLMASVRNAVLVVPQGPFNASDSFGGKLEDPDGFAQGLQKGRHGQRRSHGIGVRIVMAGDQKTPVPAANLEDIFNRRHDRAPV